MLLLAQTLLQFKLNLILDTRISVHSQSVTLRLTILDSERGELETSCQRLLSLNSITKKLAFIALTFFCLNNQLKKEKLNMVWDC